MSDALGFERFIVVDGFTTVGDPLAVSGVCFLVLDFALEGSAVGASW